MEDDLACIGIDAKKEGPREAKLALTFYRNQWFTRQTLFWGGGNAKAQLQIAAAIRDTQSLWEQLT